VEHGGLSQTSHIEGVIVLAERFDPERDLRGLCKLKGQHQRRAGRGTVDAVDIIVSAGLEVLHDSENAGVIPVSLAGRVERTGESVAVPEVERAKGVHESRLGVPSRRFEAFLRE